MTENVVAGPDAEGGGGIWNLDIDGSEATVTLDTESSVTGNRPDDCVGTPACQP